MVFQHLCPKSQIKSPLQSPLSTKRSSFFSAPNWRPSTTTLTLLRVQKLTCNSPAMRGGYVALAVALLLVATADGGEVLNGAKLSGIIIPGFASTQLRAWSILDCPYSPLDFNPLDLVWLDTTKVMRISYCFTCSVSIILIQSSH